MNKNQPQEKSKDVKKIIGKRLKEARKRVGISQKELADMIGYKVGTISKYEQGDRLPPYDTLLELSESLKCPLSDLTEGHQDELAEEQIKEEAYDHFTKWLLFSHVGGFETTYHQGDEVKSSLLVNIDGITYDIYDNNEVIQKILLENLKTLTKIMGYKI